MRRRAAWAAAGPVLLAVALLGAGCNDQSTLDGHSPQSRDIATLWWWLLAAATIVFAGAVAMLGVGYARRRKRGLPVLGENEAATRGLVLVFGIAIPIVVLVAVFAVANFTVISKTRAPAVASTRMTIEIVGHEWFWEVRYPGTTAVTANEIHIPARTRVDVVATTGDVIHSLWVPELNRKIDMIPGQRNRILFYADRSGVYRGQCAEFCGPQHAHMAMKVFAQPPAQFRAWLRNMAAPRRAPAGASARAGERAFLAGACASCHAIRGTPARGQIGPDLTHLATRTSLAADTIPNRRGLLAAWIRDPQHFKPQNKMPALSIRAPELRALVDYLEGLR